MNVWLDRPTESWIIAALVLMIVGWLVNWILRWSKITPMEQAGCAGLLFVIFVGFGYFTWNPLWVMPSLGQALALMKQHDDSL